jgi:TFIIF-interacting CTD phosphatase-like protein
MSWVAPPPARPLLVLDLDETLVHVTALPTPTTDFVIRVGRHRMHVHVRPFAAEALRLLLLEYDIFIFTAAAKNYTDKIVDVAFPFVLPDRRLYGDSCQLICGYRVKDLRLLGRPLHRTVMIDDIFGSAMLQPENIFVVPPWMGDTDDAVFQTMPQLLLAASAAGDVTAELRKLVALGQSPFVQIARQ